MASMDIIWSGDRLLVARNWVDGDSITADITDVTVTPCPPNMYDASGLDSLVGNREDNWQPGMPVPSFCRSLTQCDGANTYIEYQPTRVSDVACADWPGCPDDQLVVSKCGFYCLLLS